MVSLVRSIISLSSDFGLPANFEDWKHIVAWQQVNQCRDDRQTSSLWYQLMSHYTDKLCANFEEAPGRAHKRIRYICLTMSLHWFRLWLGAAYTTHYCLNKWWHKPTMYVCVTWPYNVNTWRPRQNGRHLPDNPDSKVHGAHLGPTWGPPGSCRPQMDPMLAPWTLLSGDIFKFSWMKMYDFIEICFWGSN